MRTVPLGPSGAAVSALCLGAMRFGTSTDRATSYAILDRFRAVGGTFIDTANIYASWEPGGQGGDSERLLADWLRDRNCRDEIVLATKVGSKLQASGRGLRAQQIAEEFAASRERLRVDQVDLLYAHFDDPHGTPIAESMGAFAALVAAGTVRHLGASNFSAWRLETVRGVCEREGLPDYCCLQQRHSFLRADPWANYGNQQVATPEILDYCEGRGLSVLAYSPLLGGCYAGRADRPVPRQYRSPVNEARLAAVRELAAEMGCTAAQVVYAWLLASRPAVVPIIGCSSVAQLDEAIAALDLVLDAAAMQRLDVRA